MPFQACARFHSQDPSDSQFAFRKTPVTAAMCNNNHGRLSRYSPSQNPSVSQDPCVSSNAQMDGQLCSPGLKIAWCLGHDEESKGAGDDSFERDMLKKDSPPASSTIFLGRRRTRMVLLVVS